MAENYTERRRLDQAVKDVHPEPTPAQREAANYRHGHVRLHGLDISIEVAKGGVRKGVNKSTGESWSKKMKAHYGRIKRTTGADAENFDVYIGDHPESEIVFVINQVNKDGSFNEHKGLLAYTNAEEAQKSYLAHIPREYMGSMVSMTMDQFKKWVFSSRTRFPLRKRAEVIDLDNLDKEAASSVSGNSMPFFPDIQAEYAIPAATTIAGAAADGDKRSPLSVRGAVQGLAGGLGAVGSAALADAKGYGDLKIPAGAAGGILSYLLAKKLTGEKEDEDRPWRKRADLLPGVSLQPHQQNLADEAEQHPLRKLLVHGLGSGKSFSSIAASEARKEPYVAVVPASLRPNFRKEIAKWTDQQTPHQVLSYSEIAQGKQPKVTGSLIADECLPLGTLVDGKPIETLLPGQFVRSINHETGHVELAKITRSIQRLTDCVFEFEFEQLPQKLVCTEDHPLFTQRGYVPAKEITTNDLVFYFGDKRGSTHQHNQLCNLRQKLHIKSIPVSRSAEALLCGLSEEGLGQNHEENLFGSRGKPSGENAKQQSDEKRNISTQNVEYSSKNRTQTQNTGWERKRPNQTRIDAGKSARVADAPHSYNRTEEDSRKSSMSLQTGYSQPRNEDSCGGGWFFPQNPGEAATGCQENQLPGFVRVARVSIHKQGSGPEFELLCPGGVVCDLTIDRNHNFFAHGYLVHNSQTLRNPDSLRTQRFKQLARQSDQVLLLSGTPLVNRPGDLAVPTEILTGRQFTPDSFEKEFVQNKPVQPGFFARLFGVKPGEHSAVKNEKQLKSLLAGKVDWHMPDKPVVPTQHEDVEVEMSPEQSALYRSVWEKLPWHLRWKFKNQFPLSGDEMMRARSFLTGPRQVSLSTLPYMTNPDPQLAFQQSAKLNKAMELLQEKLKDPRAKALIFSNFIDAGLTPYASALSAANIPNAVFHGGLTDAARKKLVDDYNNDKLRVALLGPSGSEGLSFRGTQLIQLLDPHWTGVRGKQSVGRGLRFDSHEGLPPDLQNVHVQRFISRQPLSLRDKALSALGFDRAQNTHASDDYLLDMEKRKEELNRQFMDILREVGTKKAS